MFSISRIGLGRAANFFAICWSMNTEIAFPCPFFSIAFSNLIELALGGDQKVFSSFKRWGLERLVGQMGLNSITAFNLASGCSQNQQGHLGGNSEERERERGGGANSKPTVLSVQPN